VRRAGGGPWLRIRCNSLSFLVKEDSSTRQPAIVCYDFRMARRKKAKTKAPAKPSHRYVRAGFARLRENRYAEAEQAFQRALSLAHGTDELDGEDVARIEHLIGANLDKISVTYMAR
jgi:hypothetical protein